ncbi:hypothetical protein DMUE_0952 [Dictyocoela muelleri]|nr:hypothetical protein DMUE_0952 [Dictyocoela muelleri]
MKKSAIENDETFEKFLLKETVNLNQNEKKFIGNIDNLRDYYTKLRRESQNPINRHGEDILEIYKYTHDDELFLQLDTGKSDKRRIFIFYRYEHLKLSTKTNCIMCDATFRSAPRGFEQLLALHATFFNKRIPIDMH